MSLPANDDTRPVDFNLPPGLSAITARYHVLAEAGRGGMGVVYKARDRQTHDIVAVKVLHPLIASDASLVERFKNELILARRVTHKNVCRVYDLNDFNGTTVIAMEFVEGESLLDMLGRAQGVSVRHGLGLARQVIAGLGEAHAQGVVHRDLKPANILVGRDGTVKVMDFGIARSIHSQQTSAGLIIGTPAYMSPEQAEGQQPDARSDIYSLGVVLFEMFCGEPVFSADSTAALVAKHVNERPRSPLKLEPNLPAHIAGAVLKCLEKKPDKRFQSVAELDAALAEQAGSLEAPTEADATRLPAHLAHRQGSDLVLVAAAVVGLLVFFPSFARTSLAPGNEVSFDRNLLRRIVLEHRLRLGGPGGTERSVHVYANTRSYSYLAKEHGASTARQLASNLVPWLWQTEFQDGGRVDVNSRGELMSYYRRAVPADSELSQRLDARAVAERALIDAWRQQPSSLTLERSSAGGQISSFSWVNPTSPYSLEERYAVNVDAKGIQYMWRSVSAPPGYEPRDLNWNTTASIVAGLLGSAVGFLQRHRFATMARWRTVVGAVAFLGGVATVLLLWSLSAPSDYLMMSLALGLLTCVGFVLGSVAVESQIWKTQPARLYTLARIVGRGATSEPCGLAILRGTLIGLALLGIDAVAIWLLTTYAGAYLDAWRHILVPGRALSSGWPVAAVLALAWYQALGIGLLVAFMSSVGERLIARSWLRGVVPVILLAVSGIHVSMASVQPYYCWAALLFIDYLILVFAFRRFDLLTLFVTVFTFAFWWGNYPLLVMQQPIGATWPLTAFAVWGCIIATAIAIAFQSTLRPVYQRLAALLD